MRRRKEREIGELDESERSGSEGEEKEWETETER